jgi:catechol 2,3-dioxygenase-like lactoylglutathione lyase family enzyme
MLDHVGFAVADLHRSRRFYEAALQPLGIELLFEIPAELTESGGTALGFGTDGKAFFWIGDNEDTGEGTHVAFTAASRAAVRAFYQAGIGAGGRDHGAPGLRPHYHEHYYGAFLLDPDGFNIEAVCHKPEPADAHLHHRL